MTLARWFVALAPLALAACSAASPSDEPPPPTEVDVKGLSCGGAAAKACPQGYECVAPAGKPSASAGTCKKTAPPAEVFPASHAPPRQIVKLAGPVLKHPTVIPIFFGDDADRAQTEAVLARLPGSDYWKLLGEYGVGDVTIGASVVLADAAPATFSLDGVDAAVAALWARAKSPAPTPDGTQIYTVVFPKRTDLRQIDGSRFCDAGGAYHSSRGTEFAYAITPHCTDSFDDFIVSVTHELIEAATDPFPLVNPAWAGADPGHVGFRSEVSDLCDFGGPIGVATGAPLFGTRVERIFSNARARTGHDPCLPDLGLPFFGAAPAAKDAIVFDDPILGPLPGKGVVVKVGASATVTLDLYSDRKLDPWAVSVDAMDLGTSQASDAIEVALDRDHGANGEALHLRITRKKASASGDLVFVRSVGPQAYWSDSIYVGQ